MVPVSKIRQGEDGVVLWVDCVHWALICVCLFLWGLVYFCLYFVVHRRGDGDFEKGDFCPSGELDATQKSTFVGPRRE